MANAQVKLGLEDFEDTTGVGGKSRLNFFTYDSNRTAAESRRGEKLAVKILADSAGTLKFEGARTYSTQDTSVSLPGSGGIILLDGQAGIALYTAIGSAGQPVVYYGNGTRSQNLVLDGTVLYARQGTGTHAIVLYKTSGDAATQSSAITVVTGKSAGTSGHSLVLKSSATVPEVTLANVKDPTASQHAATKNYVDGLVQGISWKTPVKAYTERYKTNTLSGLVITAVQSGSSNTADIGLFNVSYQNTSGTTSQSDGNLPSNNDIFGSGVSAFAVGDRILINGQISPSTDGVMTNGIFEVARMSAITGQTHQIAQIRRTTDFNSRDDILGAAVFVREGGTNENKGYVLDSPAGFTYRATLNAAGEGSGTGSASSPGGQFFIKQGTSGATAEAAPLKFTMFNDTAGSMITRVTGGNGINIPNPAAPVVGVDVDTNTLTNTGGTGDQLALRTTVQRDDTTKFVNASGASTAVLLAVTDAASTKHNFSVGADGTIRVGADHDTASGSTFEVNPDGTVRGNEFIADSDRTLKQDITPMPASAALAAVAAMGPHTYAFKDKPSDPRCGVIAQELQLVAPELVKMTTKGTLAVDYNDMTAYLIGAIQALDTRLAEHASVIQRLSTEQPSPMAAL